MKKVLALATMAFLVCIQFATIGVAHAAGNDQVQFVSVSMLYDNGGILSAFCNGGSTDIKSATFDTSLTNVEITGTSMFLFAGDPSNFGSDLGSLDLNTMEWNGMLEPSKCVPFFFTLNDTSEVGDTAEFNLWVTSTTEVDDSTETYADHEQQTLQSWTIAPPSDLSTEAHLVTTGDIGPGDPISYQIDVRNTGGTFTFGNFMIYVFVMPEGSTFTGVEDLDPDDDLLVDTDQCESGYLVSTLGIPGLEPYSDRTIVQCNLAVNNVEQQIPASDTPFSFRVNLTAGSSLATGTTDVLGLIEGNEQDTADFILSVLENQDVFESEINNVTLLQYNPDELVVTVNRCPGQSETTTDGTGCFRVSFSKKIYAPSFTEDDIALTGGATVSDFNQLDDFTWEIHVAGITPGSTLVVVLDEDSVQDYSAVQNNVHVLGENTIRFEVPGQSQNNSPGSTSGNVSGIQGELAATGANSSLINVVVMLIGTGAILLASGRRRIHS